MKMHDIHTIAVACTMQPSNQVQLSRYYRSSYKANMLNVSGTLLCRPTMQLMALFLIQYMLQLYRCFHWEFEKLSQHTFFAELRGGTSLNWQGIIFLHCWIANTYTLSEIVLKVNYSSSHCCCGEKLCITSLNYHIAHCRCDFLHGSPQLLILNLISDLPSHEEKDLVTIEHFIDWAESVASNHSKSNVIQTTAS